MSRPARGRSEGGNAVPVHPQVQMLLDGLAAAGSPPLHETEPEAARQMMRALASMEERVEVERVDDRTVPGPGGDVPVRVYTPAESIGANHGVLIWIHGGGWVIGDLETADPTCRLLAQGSGCVVVSVDYRLSPEHRAPAALEDCLAVVAWTVENAEALGCDASRLAIGGDSAGGNLAALACLRLRDEFGPEVDFQLLVYPVTDLTRSHPSYEANAEGYFLTAESMRWFVERHLGDEIDPKDPMVSPLHAESLEGLPKALVITAELDPLRDEGEAYAQRLREAGVEVEHVRYDGQIHGFFAMATMLDDGKAAVAKAAEALRKELA
jgi:acetyl esterase